MVVQNANWILLLHRLSMSRLLAVKATLTCSTRLVSRCRLRLLLVHGRCCSRRLRTRTFSKVVCESYCSLSFLLSKFRLRLCCSCGAWRLKRLVTGHARVPVLIEYHVVVVLRDVALQAVMLTQESDKLV